MQSTNIYLLINTVLTQAILYLHRHMPAAHWWWWCADFSMV